MKVFLQLVLLQQNCEPDASAFIEAAQALALVRDAGITAMGHLVRTDQQRQEVVRTCRKSDAKIIALIIGRNQLEPAKKFIEGLRGLPPSTSIAVMGSWGTFYSSELTQKDNVQVAFLGDWVEGLAEYAETEMKQGLARSTPGTMIRDFRGWQIQDQRVYKPDLSSWPLPELSDFRFKDFIKLQGRSIPIQASRGFPFKSSASLSPLFRHLHEADFHYHTSSPERVIEFAELSKEQFRARRFEFVDELFPWMDDWLDEFTDLWKTRIGLPFSIRSAVEYLEEENVNRLRRAGLDHVYFQVEGGDEELRRNLTDINQTNERLCDTVERLSLHQVKSTVHLLLGVPGETSETLKESIELVRMINAFETTAERFQEWPNPAEWASTERALTGGKNSRRTVVKYGADFLQEIDKAILDIQHLNTLNRCFHKKRKPQVDLDAISDYKKIKSFEPQHAFPSIRTFHSPSGSEEVLSFRVPGEIVYKVDYPSRPVVSFGILLEPSLPGERVSAPVLFSLRAIQDEKAVKVFEKVLIQALDPDSRRWHWFKIPIPQIKKGKGTLSLRARFYGSHAEGVDINISAGWAKLYISSKNKKLEGDIAAEETDAHQFESFIDEDEAFTTERNIEGQS